MTLRDIDEIYALARVTRDTLKKEPYQVVIYGEEDKVPLLPSMVNHFSDVVTWSAIVFFLHKQRAKNFEQLFNEINKYWEEYKLPTYKVR